MSENEIKQLQEKVSALETQVKTLHGIKDNGRRFYSNEEFKKVFKIGDKLSGWSTGKTVIITAIGEKRFLAYCDYYKAKEIVCTMDARAWIKIP